MGYIHIAKGIYTYKKKEKYMNSITTESNQVARIAVTKDQIDKLLYDTSRCKENKDKNKTIKSHSFREKLRRRSAFTM